MPKSKHSNARFSAYLETLDREGLIALVHALAEEIPDVHRALNDRLLFSEGKPSKLFDEAAAIIDTVGDPWDWNEYGPCDAEPVDWRRLERLLKAVAEQGDGEGLLELGRRLLKEGSRRVEQEHDQESFYDIQHALEVIHRTLPDSSLPRLRQAEWVIEQELGDEYDLLQEIPTTPITNKLNKGEWSALADRLLSRLDAMEKREKHYRRNQLSGWAIFALEQAKRADEAMTLAREEARITGSYTRLVEKLLLTKRRDEAIATIIEGVESGAAAGTVSQLIDQLVTIKRRSRDWPQVAALRADAFLHYASLDRYEAANKAAAKANAGEAVRASLLGFLEDGRDPRCDKGWPLPPPLASYGPPTATPNRIPDTELLIDIAIAEQRTEEVLRWYRTWETRKGRYPWDVLHMGPRVADALAETYPDEAIAIWKAMVAMLIAETKPKSYQQAEPFLQRIKRRMNELKRKQEWEGYLAGLRREHHRKRRLMEVLDGV